MTEETVSDFNDLGQLEQQFRQVKSWDDGLQLAADMRKADDELKLGLGDLVRYLCPSRKGGRPAINGVPEGSRMQTLTALSGAMDIERSELSNLANNAEFWNLTVRGELPASASWRALAKARKASGWKPGQPPTPRQVADAFDALYADAEKPHETPERSLESMVKGVINLCDKLLARRSELGSDARPIIERTRKDWKDMAEWIS